MEFKHYEVIANMFRYPEDESFLKRVEDGVALLNEKGYKAAEEAQAFYDRLPKQDMNALQELYTRSFDVQAITTLDVGYVLFGDDYKRGEILSNLNREHAEAQNDCGVELADHLPNLLRLISKLKNADLRQELVQVLLAPALSKMIQEFNPERLEKKNKLYKKHYKTLIETSKKNYAVYAEALKAVLSVLKQDFNLSDGIGEETIQNDFLNSVGTEMTVEKLATE